MDSRSHIFFFSFCRGERKDILNHNKRPGQLVSRCPTSTPGLTFGYPTCSVCTCAHTHTHNTYMSTPLAKCGDTQNDLGPSLISLLSPPLIPLAGSKCKPQISLEKIVSFPLVRSHAVISKTPVIACCQCPYLCKEDSHHKMSQENDSDDKSNNNGAQKLMQTFQRILYFSSVRQNGVPAQGHVKFEPILPLQASCLENDLPFRCVTDDYEGSCAETTCLYEQPITAAHYVSVAVMPPSQNLSIAESVRLMYSRRAQLCTERPLRRNLCPCIAQS